MVPIHKNFRKFLRFTFENNIWEFTCLPFGLNIAPLVFTKLLKPAIFSFRKQGIVCIIYLDDILIISVTAEEANKNTSTALSGLKSLCFLINQDKSQLVPQTTCTFLGFNYNKINMQLSLPSKKDKK